MEKTVNRYGVGAVNSKKGPDITLSKLGILRGDKIICNMNGSEFEVTDPDNNMVRLPEEFRSNNSCTSEVSMSEAARIVNLKLRRRNWKQYRGSGFFCADAAAYRSGKSLVDTNNERIERENMANRDHLQQQIAAARKRAEDLKARKERT